MPNITSNIYIKAMVVEDPQGRGTKSERCVRVGDGAWLKRGSALHSDKAVGY